MFQFALQNGRPKVRRHADLIALFCLALVLRGVTLWAAVSQLGADYFLSYPPDTVNYLKAANGLFEVGSDGEPALFSFGPGFPLVLRECLRLFGNSALPYLMIQIVLSSLSCLLVYRLGRQIVGDYWISITAGLFVACSVTAISLSCFVLSDSLYVFMFLLSLVLFFDGLNNGRWPNFLLSGFILGFAILTRSIGQFWPGALIVFTLIFNSKRRQETMRVDTKGRVFWKVAVSLLICIVMVTAWVARNKAVDGIYTLTIASAGGPANVAALALEKQTGRRYRWIIDDWYKEREQSEGKQKFNLAEDYRMLQSHAETVLRESPAEMASAYLRTVWENLTQRDYLHEDLLSKSPPSTLLVVRLVNWGQAWIWLSLAGIFALLLSRHFGPAILLGSGFLYYATMIGFTRFQGSRLFHPGFIFGALLSATALVVTLRLARGIAARVRMQRAKGTHSAGS